MTKINFTVSAEEKEAFKPQVPFGPGIYDFEILEVKAGEASTGTRRLEVTLLANHDGRQFKVFDNVYLTDSSKWRYDQFCECFGLDSTNEELDTDEFQGAEGVCSLGPKEDSAYMEVKRYQPVGYSGPSGPANASGVDAPPF